MMLSIILRGLPYHACSVESWSLFAACAQSDHCLYSTIWKMWTNAICHTLKLCCFQCFFPPSVRSKVLLTHLFSQLKNELHFYIGCLYLQWLSKPVTMGMQSRWTGELKALASGLAPSSSKLSGSAPSATLAPLHRLTLFSKAQNTLQLLHLIQQITPNPNRSPAFSVREPWSQN